METKLPSPEAVEASIKRNLLKIRDRSDELHSLIEEEPQTITEAEGTLPEKYKRIMLLVKSAADIVAPISACGKGCGHCCKMAVTVTSYEAELIGKAVGVEPAKNVKMSLDQDAMVAQYMNVPCTFLKKGICQIYDHRPLPCRTHFNVSDFPQLCDTINHPGQDVPNINFTKLWFASSVLGLEGDCIFADLREFFPEGLNPTESL